MTYFDNILIYSNFFEKYKSYIKIILKCLHAAKLYLDVIKYKFYIRKVCYLGFIISTKRSKMNPAKIKIITDWPQPKCLRDIQNFLGFTKFY